MFGHMFVQDSVTVTRRIEEQLQSSDLEDRDSLRSASSSSLVFRRCVLW